MLDWVRESRLRTWHGGGSGGSCWVMDRPPARREVRDGEEGKVDSVRGLRGLA